MKAGTDGGGFRRHRAATSRRRLLVLPQAGGHAACPRRGADTEVRVPCRKAAHGCDPLVPRTGDEVIPVAGVARSGGSDGTTPRAPAVGAFGPPSLRAGAASTRTRCRRGAPPAGRPVRGCAGDHDRGMTGTGVAPARHARRGFPGRHVRLIARHAEPTGAPAESLEGVR
ncbi:hypothetical protein ACFPN0_15755 [Kitasatospora cinereorecta]